jgi:hypothetical protein
MELILDSLLFWIILDFRADCINSSVVEEDYILWNQIKQELLKMTELIKGVTSAKIA